MLLKFDILYFPLNNFKTSSGFYFLFLRSNLIHRQLNYNFYSFFFSEKKFKTFLIAEGCLASILINVLAKQNKYHNYNSLILSNKNPLRSQMVVFPEVL